jgi:hypothetical protein
MICEAKDLRKTLKVILTQVILELPEGKMLHSTREGKSLVLSRLGVSDENYWGVYDRGVSVFTNNLSSVVYELKKKGILTVPKPLHWGKPSVQESLFETEVVMNEKQEDETIEEKIVVDVVLPEVVSKTDLQEDETIEEKHLKNQVALKGLMVLNQAIKDMGGYYGSEEGGCYGGYGKLPMAICDGGEYKGKKLRPCALRMFCKNV